MRGLAGSKDQFSEIFVFGQENAEILVGKLEHHGILDAGMVLADKADVVARFSEHDDDVTVDALVTEKLWFIRQWDKLRLPGEPVRQKPEPP